MEAAIDTLARRLGVDVAADEQRVPSVRRFPFDPRRRRMSVVVGEPLFVKGAPDAVLPRCARTDGRRAEAAARRWRRAACGCWPSRRGRRRLADADDADEAEADLELLGPGRAGGPAPPSAAAAIAACRQAGIRVAMVTGDHPATARAIAARGRPARRRRHSCSKGRDLPPDDEVLGALLDRDGMVVARVVARGQAAHRPRLAAREATSWP